jgi:hypothetical protein
MARGERNTIRITVAALLSGGLSIPFFDYSPDDAMVVFGDLPAGVVDWDLGRSDRWVHTDQGIERYSYLLIEVYEPVSEDDHGKASSEAIASKLEAAEAILRHNVYLGKMVDGSQIMDSKIEGVAAELEGTGIKARFAWLVLEVKVVK